VPSPRLWRRISNSSPDSSTPRPRAVLINSPRDGGQSRAAGPQQVWWERANRVRRGKGQVVGDGRWLQRATWRTLAHPNDHPTGHGPRTGGQHDLLAPFQWGSGGGQNSATVAALSNLRCAQMPTHPSAVFPATTLV